jgi:hypothetical protein
LLGIRVVTYLEDATFRVAAAIERAFDIDYARSLDKRGQLDPTQFGYRSLHYVCRLSGEADQRPFEIQVRTVLQHAWAEIEHDLGYKASARLPPALRRRFSRLASLLELADEEFVAIKRGIAAYDADVRSGAPTVIKARLDELAVQAFAQAEPIAALDAEIARRLGLPLVETVFYPDYLARMLDKVGLATLEDVGAALARHRDAILAFLPAYFRFTAETWRFGARDVAEVQRGYGLMFLAHVSLLQKSPLALDQIEVVTDFYAAMDYPDDRATARAVAVRFVETYAVSCSTSSSS